MSLSTYTTEVRPEWIDYNGHLSEAYYVLVFGFATDEAMDALGLDAAYRERTGCSLYTVEGHVRYLQEVALGAPLTVTTDVVAAEGKKLHLAHAMFSGETLIATEEILGLHMDQNLGKTTPLPDAASSAAQAALAAAPEWSGRSVGL